ncbi:hypothetical protein [Paraburkholderia sp. UYCP14C]|uniref:hypothetical protein n=1 Tax=Paraburkholderia sp. UYCP14C TaxID=2511130 RepID=UPI00145A0091
MCFTSRARQRFADPFEARAPTLGKGDAMRVAEVALMIARGPPGLYARQTAAERRRLQAEVEAALTAYLRDRPGAD